MERKPGAKQGNPNLDQMRVNIPAVKPGKRTVIISVRVTEDEADFLDSLPSGLSKNVREALSQYLKEAGCRGSDEADHMGEDEDDTYDWGGVDPLTIGKPVYHDLDLGLLFIEEE